MSSTENAAAPQASTTSGLFAQPISAGLARRLAEAATGYADEGEVYVVARYIAGPDLEDPYDVQACSTLADAQQVQADGEARTGAGYGIFGPFESTLIVPGAGRQQVTVDSFQVTTSGPAQENPFTIPGKNYDALFYSAAAVKKFAVPYYASLYSGAYGDQVLTSFQESPMALMAHMPWSEYTTELFNAEGGTEPVSTEPAATELIAAEIAVIFTLDDAGNVRARPLHPNGPGGRPQGAQTPRNAGSRAT